MPSVSKLALAVALSLGAVTLATPADAQRRNQQEQPELQVSEEFRAPAAETQTAIAARDWATAEAALARAEAVAQNDDEKYFSAWLRLQVETGTSDNDGVIAALDQLLANPKTPQDRLAAINFERGRRAMIKGDAADGLPYLERAREMGSTESNLPLLLASAYFDNNRNDQGIAALEQALAAEESAGRKAPENWYNLGVAKLYAAGDRARTADWLMRTVKAYPTVPNWRRVLVLYRESADAAGTGLDRAQKIDLYRLMRASGALADQGDYFDYAQAAQESGLPWEAIAVVDEARAQNVAANTSAFDSVYRAAQSALRTEQPLSTYERQANSSANGRMAAQTGDAYLASGNNAKAAELYRLALEKGGVDAEAVRLHLGIAQARAGDKAAAEQTLSQVSGQGATADIAGFWSTWMELPPLAPAAPAAAAAAQAAPAAN